MSTFLKSTFSPLRPLSVRDELLQRHIRIFTRQDFERLFSLPHHQAKYFLETYTDRGLFVRLKKSLYALKGDFPSEEEIANALYKPSYISFEYALQYYHIIPEMVYAITSATTKPTRNFTVEGKPYLFFTIKKSAYTGYFPLKKNSQIIFMAEPEKAFTDYLYFVALKKKEWNERFSLKYLKRRKILQYIRLYKNKKLNFLSKKFL